MVARDEASILGADVGPPRAQIRDRVSTRLAPFALLTLRRVAALVPTALVASFVIFVLIRLVPGGPAEARLGQGATQSALKALNHELGLDRPLLSQYWTWLSGVLHGDLGRSLQSGEPVSRIVGAAWPVTTELVGLATLLTVVVAVPVGVYVAVRAGTKIDAAVTSSSGLGLTVPDFFLAIVMIDLFAVTVKVFPPLGYERIGHPAENLRHLALPVVTLGLGAGAVIVRQVRSAMIDALRSEHVRTARAMGLRESTVIWRYAFRTALPTIVNVYGLLIIGLLGSTVILEQIFVLPGLGNDLILAVNAEDYTMMQGIVVIYVVAVLTLNLLVDLIELGVEGGRGR